MATGAMQWFGTSSEGMKDRPILEVIGPHVFAQVERDKVARALAGEEVIYEYSMPGPGGETFVRRSAARWCPTSARTAR